MSSTKKIILGAIVFFLCALIAALFILESSKIAESFYKQGVNYFGNRDYVQASRYFKIAALLDSRTENIPLISVTLITGKKTSGLKKPTLKRCLLAMKRRCFTQTWDGFTKSRKKIMI